MSSEKNPNVAYFCMEYGIDQRFKAYAGGLGILAGDYLKGAHDHQYPIIGIGIRWKQGYTEQKIDASGNAYDSYHNYKYDFLEDTGITVSVDIRKVKVNCKVWKLTQFGNADLYLLDTDIPDNHDSWITGQLYGWFGEERIAQEIVLGIGGIKAIRALGLPIDIYHFNEGHALFAGFELLREKMEDEGLTFEKAVEVVKKEVVFTTHTPIVQGNESHPIDKIIYMGANLNLTRAQLTFLGGGDPFNMTIGALRLSKIANGVAQLHGETSNKMWAEVDKRADILAITNAIHLPTWVDNAMIRAAEDGSDLWEPHLQNKRALIDFIEAKNGVRLDEEKLIIGFSRRAAPYKRSDFIFTDLSIIEPLLLEKKFQIVFSGKAHPLDDVGKLIVKNLVAMSRKYPKAVVFLENYDMSIGRMLTRGSDIWLNNPRRPLEASGTSGMKAAMNGVLNLSILDGWWPEACVHGVTGWQFGDGFEHEEEEIQDAHDLKALYKVLLEEVIPTYYENKSAWMDMMRESILQTKEPFAVKRMLEEYYELLYKFEA
ncbi:MAG: alpha-glucan family phosphorylase [Saprospiraceae bacterium]|nr:alpha-glucan family phosphorylase [Saprospiraceae bacterium]MDP4700339.1 alpha-glucan family phosphorylase [Saprospiraceae bacterium]MDP4813686.1 alpha-glucan family phosphorylase [Saprospiraceae bacterium]MDP5048140.1 alpha-glucan family phosphorylase [Saprospiraceae bacterium]MDP5090687.1 alpha-glucan family phosphorylase [Saprospiraceae bacterium]